MDYLSVKQAAEYVGVSGRTIQRLIKAGRLPAAKLGGQWRIRKAALDAMLQAGEGGDRGQDR